MTFKNYINEDSTEVNLYGKKVDDKKVLKNRVWAGDFDCSKMGLTSLEGAPKIINGYFKCIDNPLKSFIGAPEKVNGDFYIGGKTRISLEGITRHINGDFVLRTISGDFGITSLHNVQKHFDTINGQFYFRNTNLKSHVLGLLLIPGITCVYLFNRIAQDIMNSHLPNKNLNRNVVIECQNELIDAGFEEFAQL